MRIDPRMQPAAGRYDRSKLLGWSIEVDRRESGLIAASLPLVSVVGWNFRASARDLVDRSDHEENPLATIPATSKQLGVIATRIHSLDPHNLPIQYIFDPVTGHHETTAEAREASWRAHRTIVHALTEVHFLPLGAAQP